MPKSFDAGAARKISAAEEAPKRAPKLRVLEGEGRGSVTTPDAEKMLEMVTERAERLHEEPRDPNTEALRAIKQYEMVKAMARQAGTMNQEALGDAVTALRDAKTMMESRQHWLQQATQPNQKEVERNWGLIQSLERALEHATEEPEIISKNQKVPESRAAREERMEAKNISGQLQEAKIDLQNSVTSFKAEYGMTPQQLDEQEEPGGIVARMKHWLLMRRAEPDLVMWRAASERVRKLEGKLKRRSVAVPKIEELEPEQPKPKIQKAQEEAPKETPKPIFEQKETRDRGRDKSVEVYQPMSIAETHTYVPQAEALWNMIQEKIDELTELKEKKHLLNALNVSQTETDDLPSTKLVFDIARLLKAQKMGADATTLKTIERRVNAAASTLGIQNNALFQSTLAYRPEAVKDVLKGAKSRKEKVNQENAR